MTTTTSPPQTTTSTPRRMSAATLGYIIVFGVIPLLIMLFFLLRYMYRNRQAMVDFFRRRPQVLGAPPSSGATVRDLSSGSAPS